MASEFTPEKMCDLPHDHQWPQAFYERLQPKEILKQHKGCVNSVTWHPTGDYLISGSDDLHLALWNYPDGNCLSYTRTSHTNDIISVQWLLDGMFFGSSGRDGGVGLYQVAQSRIVEQAFFRCHERQAMCLASYDENIIWSCSLDGTVREYDRRTPHICMDDDFCRNAIVYSAYVDFNSISASNLNRNLFAVSGQEPAVQIFDRRNLVIGSKFEVKSSSPLWTWIPSLSEIEGNMTSSVAFSSSSTELAVSIGGGSIYVIDPLTDHKNNAVACESLRAVYTKPHESHQEGYDLYQRLSSSHSHLRSFPEFRAITAYEICNMAISKILQLPQNRIDLHQILKLRDSAKEFIPISDMAIIHRISFFALLIFASFTKAEQTLQSSRWQDNWKEARLLEYARSISEEEDYVGLLVACELFDLKTIDITATDAFKSLSTIPGRLYDFSKQFKEHNNEVDVKNVSFVGKRSEYVASGSDSGYFCLLDKETMEPILIAHGDSKVQGHPSLPILATCGIDNDVKIWKPAFK